MTLLESKPEIVNLRLLKTIPEYIEHTKSFKKDNVSNAEESKLDPADENLTPEESLEYSFQKINKSLAQDLPAKIKKMQPHFLKNL